MATCARFFSLGVFALTAIGCETAADVITQKRDSVNKAFSGMPGAGFIEKLDPPTGTIELTKPAVVLEGAESNAMFVYVEDLRQLRKAPAGAALRTIDSIPLLQCVSLLETGHLFNDTITRVSPSLATSYLDACARLKYVFVIRTRLYTRPELQFDTKQFAPGKYEADVYVSSLDGRLLGGFHVSATNDASVSLLDGDKNHVQRLISNLESTTFNALRDGAQKALPGAIP